MLAEVKPQRAVTIPPSQRELTRTLGKYDAQTAWKKENQTRIVINLNHNTDTDILRFLKSVPSKQGTIKQALRAFIASVTSADDEK